VPVHEAAAQAGLVRPLQGRVIAGVCAGFARRYGWDPVMVRLLMVLCFFVAAGTPVFAYIVAWIVMPNELWLVPAQMPSAPPPNPTGPPVGTMGA
jgi:phage shock protein PspC (stress-responsive transcriptional regulator)